MKGAALVAYRLALVLGFAWLAGRTARPAPLATAGTLRTAPSCDGILGYAGPNDCEIRIDAAGRIEAVRLVHSGDTAEHAAAVRDDPEFFAGFVGMDARRPEAFADLDGVTRATLTSLAIVEAVRARLAEADPDTPPTPTGGSLRFPDHIHLEEVRRLVPEAESLGPAGGSRREVFGPGAVPIATALRTGPGHEAITGYQGPADALLVVDPDRVLRSLALRRSYDNEPYLGYLRDDSRFAEQFVGRTLGQLAEELPRPGDPAPFAPHEVIDGVSGATMTSLAVGEGILRTAAREVATRPAADALASAAAPRWTADLGTGIAILLALMLTFTRLRSHRRLRTLTRIGAVVYLGILSGTMLSQGLLVGWSRHGLPWHHAPGLVALAATAILVPVTTGHQTYCHQLCPHGALQDLVRRSGWQRPVPERLYRLLRPLPGITLAAVAAVVAIGIEGFPFYGIEPFAAWAWPLAGWATGAVLVLGILASCVYSMAYCRLGCPTGALLDLIRRRRGEDKLRLRDGVATALVLTLLVRVWLRA